MDTDYETVWSGSLKDVYLGALKGVEPFTAKPAHTVGQLALPALTTDLILAVLAQRGALTQSQLASACNRSAGATRHALKRLAKRGRVQLVEPCLFAMDPQAGALWRLK